MIFMKGAPKCHMHIFKETTTQCNNPLFFCIIFLASFAWFQLNFSVIKACCLTPIGVWIFIHNIKTVKYVSITIHTVSYISK